MRSLTLSCDPGRACSVRSSPDFTSFPHARRTAGHASAEERTAANSAEVVEAPENGIEPPKVNTPNKEWPPLVGDGQDGTGELEA